MKPRSDRSNDPRAAVYCRVSSKPQADAATEPERDRPNKPSLAQQEERTRAHCAAQGWEVVEVYRDVISGKKSERPGLQALLADAQAGAFGRVVVLKIDRLGRSLKDLLEISERLRDAGVGLVSVKDNIDTTTSSGRLYFSMLGAFAEFESDLIGERGADGRLGRVQAGRYMASQAAYGYHYDAQAGQVVVAPDEAEVVRRVYAWADAGQGVRAIAARLNEAGTPPPRAQGERRASRWGWHATTVHKLLRAPRYKGEASYAGEPMACPPIVDADLFDRVQAGRAARRQHHHKDAGTFYLLQDVVFCRTCGGRYTVKTDRANGARRYLCWRRRQYGPAAGHEGVRWSWRAEELEALVRRHVVRLLTDPDAALAAADVYEQRADGELVARTAEEGELRARLASLEDQRAHYIALAGERVITDAELFGRLATLKRDGAAARRRLADLGARPATDAARLRNWAALLRDAAGTFAQAHEVLGRADADDVAAPDDAWLAALRQLVDRVWVEADGTLTVEGRLPDAQRHPPSR